ncbi:hypothetical protein E8P82_00415 [Arthrobacter echini]|uniref:Uncharacterized protein n=1 Tax=Arthrobacter echini TaxID=1529066 RepID=A0A4V3Z5Y0_9MICC|nr:hypothetical protein [Arthrobacter echini]THJ68419.1 hypothetical protein E8P82_00415 [Arthrobacter echini]
MSQTSRGTQDGFAEDDADSQERRSTGPSKALLGPFTLREVVFGGGVLLVFIGTLLPFINGVLGYVNFWNTVPLFFVGIGILVPVAACALLAARRMGKSGLRVGSLSVDQFASVAAVLAAAFFFLQTATLFGPGPLVALIGSLALLAATIFGPFLPVIRNDFLERPEVPAHRLARPITQARPRPAKPSLESSAPSAEPVIDASPEFFSTSSAVRDSGATVSGPRPDVERINPAAAPVHQNGAGLYGAAGAGAVGAGEATAGQSGIDPDEAGGYRASDYQASDYQDGTEPSDGSVRSRADGAHAVTSRSQQDDDDVSLADERTADTSTTGASSSSSEEAPAARQAAGDATDAPARRTERRETITATRSAQDEEPVVEAFWFAVGSPRPVVDEQSGQELFVLEPGDWEVGIEDRGSEFLVQDKRSGMVGILQDLRNIERAPRD